MTRFVHSIGISRVSNVKFNGFKVQAEYLLSQRVAVLFPGTKTACKVIHFLKALERTMSVICSMERTQWSLDARVNLGATLIPAL